MDYWNPEALKVLNDLLFSLQPIRNGEHIPALKVLTQALREAERRGMERALNAIVGVPGDAYGIIQELMQSGEVHDGAS